MKIDFRKIIKKPYYYVGECPYCGSAITGRYVKARRVTENEWIIDEGLKNGELIKTIPELLGANCFCLECGTNFSYPVHMKMVSLEEIKQEKIKRHTIELLGERLSDDYHQKADGLLGTFINFVGKI